MVHLWCMPGTLSYTNPFMRAIRCDSLTDKCFGHRFSFEHVLLMLFASLSLTPRAFPSSVLSSLGPLFDFVPLSPPPIPSSRPGPAEYAERFKKDAPKRSARRKDAQPPPPPPPPSKVILVTLGLSMLRLGGGRQRNLPMHCTTMAPPVFVGSYASTGSFGFVMILAETRTAMKNEPIVGMWKPMPARCRSAVAGGS